MDENLDDKILARREYDRRYREKNLERAKENQRRYREKHKAEIAERRRKDRLENIDEYLAKERENHEKHRDAHNSASAERSRKWRREHPGAAREYDRQRHETRTPEQQEADREYKRQHYLKNRDAELVKRKVYYAANKETYAVRSRQYREANLGRIMLNAARERTRRQKLPACDLTIEYIDGLIPEVCPILGVPLEVGVGTAKPGSPSLDRIIPSLGYVQGNVQVISNKANMMKQDATWDELRRFAGWVMNTAPVKFANDY